MSEKHFVEYVKLSPNRKEETSTGYIICENCVLGSVGWLDYYAGELGIDGLPKHKRIRVYRSADELFNEESMRSLEQKALTISHPQDKVNIENDSNLRNGTIYNVRRDKDLLVGDIIITTEKAKKMLKKIKCLSLGYKFTIVPFNDTEFAMHDIVYNHIALVERGRSKVAHVKDSAENIETFNGGYSIMNMFKKKEDKQTANAKDSALVSIKSALENGEISLDDLKNLVYAKDEEKAEEEKKEDKKEEEAKDECSSKDEEKKSEEPEKEAKDEEEEDKEDEKAEKSEKDDKKSDEKEAKDSFEAFVTQKFDELLAKMSEKTANNGNDNALFEAKDEKPVEKQPENDMKTYFEETLNVHKNKNYKKECGKLSQLI